MGDCWWGLLRPFFVLGSIYSFGVFFPIYIDVFDASSGIISWIGAISAGLTTLLGVYTGPYSDKYGNGVLICLGGVVVFIGMFLASFSSTVWNLYLTQGFLCGCGYSLSFIPAVSVISQWFDKKKGLAVGIAVAGSGFGQFAIAPLTGALIREIGWQSTLRTLAVINGVGLFICGVAIKRRLPKDTSTSTQGWAMCGSMAQCFRHRQFCILYACMLFTSLGYMMPFTHLVKYAMLQGIGSSRSVFLLSIIGMSSAVGRTVMGAAGDTLPVLSVFRACLAVSALVTLLWAACEDFPSLVCFAGVFGFTAGGQISLLPLASAALFGSTGLGSLLGTLYSASAVGNFFAAPLGGVLFDYSRSYTLPIVVAGTCMCVGALASLALQLSPSPPPSSSPGTQQEMETMRSPFFSKRSGGGESMMKRASNAASTHAGHVRLDEEEGTHD